MRRRAQRLRICLFAGSLVAAGCGTARADPLPTPTPVQPAASCGLGGLKLPGSESCLRIGGFVRADASLASRRPAAASGIIPTGRGVTSTLRPATRIDAEARTQTPYGPLRAYVSVKAR